MMFQIMYILNQQMEIVDFVWQKAFILVRNTIAIPLE